MHSVYITTVCIVNILSTADLCLDYASSHFACQFDLLLIVFSPSHARKILLSAEQYNFTNKMYKEIKALISSLKKTIQVIDKLVTVPGFYVYGIIRERVLCSFGRQLLMC